MLSALKIRNFALLKDIRVEFSKGMNIITGETGAGKSIIIGALSLVLGERAKSESIRSGEDKLSVEAIFDISENNELAATVNIILDESGIDKSENELIIKREVSKNSKGRIFINNCSCSLSVLQKLGEYLIDIHGQHEHQSLLNPEEHIDLLDDYSDVLDLKGEVAKGYLKLTEISNRIKNLKKHESDKESRIIAINNSLKEIGRSIFKDSEEYNDAVSQRTRMLNVEKIKESANTILMMMTPSSLDEEGDGIIEKSETVIREMRELSLMDPGEVSDFEDIAKDIQVKSEELKAFISEYSDKTEYDKETLEILTDKINHCEVMIKKYGAQSVEGLNTIIAELEKEKKTLENGDVALEELNKEKDAITNELGKNAFRLSEIRKSKASELQKLIMKELSVLGVLKAEFEINITYAEAKDDSDYKIEKDGCFIKIFPGGIDSVEFMMSLNPGEDVKPLAKIASGGEISRIMLAIKSILSDVDRIPVMVFDEIDSGISGKIASAVGKKMKEISRTKQLLVITHLPQIAAYSDYHYSVGKKITGKRTETEINRLDDEGRERAVAMLLSGNEVTDASLKTARELIRGT